VIKAPHGHQPEASEILLTRKEVSLDLLGGAISARTIARKEKLWGLDSARIGLKENPVLYRTDGGIPALTRMVSSRVVLADGF
jgi:hypothetical protein